MLTSYENTDNILQQYKKFLTVKGVVNSGETAAILTLVSVMGEILAQLNCINASLPKDKT